MPSQPRSTSEDAGFGERPWYDVAGMRAKCVDRHK